MTRDEFWAIIDKGKSSEEPELILEQELKQLSPASIVDFQEHFDTLFDQAYAWPLWGAAYIIGGGCSDDGFIDFRYGLISRGKEVYEKALKDPDSLANIGEEIENESFGYVAAQVYENQTETELPYRPLPRIPDPPGDDWDFDDEEENRKRLPKLMDLFW